MNKTQKLLLGAGLALAGREAWSRLHEADLSGQIVLITGGSRGLGLALARQFAAHGCRLALCARDPAELERARQDLTGQGADVLTVPCDVRDRADVGRLVADVTQHFGRIDVLVNTAGIIQVGPVANMSVEDFEAALQSDFWGTLYPTLAVLPQMRGRRGGRIVNITSIGGKVSVPHLLPYSCAKFAAVGLSEGLRAELARENISVTTIAPGLMRTGSFGQALFKGRHDQEYAWFSVGDNLPGLSLSAERAARQIVRAIRRGGAHPGPVGGPRVALPRPLPRRHRRPQRPGQPSPPAARRRRRRLHRPHRRPSPGAVPVGSARRAQQSRFRRRRAPERAGVTPCL